MKSNLYVIVPVFNEQNNLPKLFGAFRELNNLYREQGQVHFILVDDGSTDDTEQQVQELSSELHLELLKHTVNHGPGYAFGTAFAYLAATIKDDDWVLTMEGDNTSRHELVGQMFQRASEGYQVILASVYIYGGSITNTN